MILLADAIKDAIITRPLTEDEQWAIDDILNAARDWAAGSMPLYMFATIGKLPGYDSANRRIESVGFARCLALMTTPKSDPRRDALNRAIGALVDAQDIVRTKHGTFERSTLFAHGLTIR